MKRIAVFLVLVVALAFASTAFGAGHAPVGDRIGIFYSGERTFPAGQAFNIRHGYVYDLPMPFLGLSEFALEVDGVLLSPSYVSRTVDTGSDPDTITLIWVYNFPNGMTGTHTFVGHWYGACGLNNGCANPAEIVEGNTSEVVITFEE